MQGLFALSDSCPAEKLAEYKSNNPDTFVVAYVNCSAAVKALSDVICTSGNAVQIVNQVPQDKEILLFRIRILDSGSSVKPDAK